MHRYYLEFILVVEGISIKEDLRNSIIEFGRDLEISCATGAPAGRELKICINTEDPTIIFDACAQFGRIKSVRVNEDDQGGTSQIK